MIRQILQTMKAHPAEVLEDTIGLGAICVMMMVALHVPVF